MSDRSRKPKKLEGPLVDRMRECEVTLDNLAVATGVERRAIQRLIEGKTHSLPRQKVEALARKLGLDLGDMQQLIERQRDAAPLIDFRRRLANVRGWLAFAPGPKFDVTRYWGPDSEQIEAVIGLLQARKAELISDPPPARKPLVLRKLRKPKPGEGAASPIESNPLQTMN